MDLTERVRDLVEEELRDSEFFVVDVIGGDNSRKISVLLDGDAGITVEMCSKVSRSISKIIDEEAFEADSFILEISSPGADQPLTNKRQYGKHIGRLLDVTSHSKGLVTGKLKEITTGGIVLIPAVDMSGIKPGKLSKSNRIKDKTPIEISFEDIEMATVIISFK